MQQRIYIYSLRVVGRQQIVHQIAERRRVSAIDSEVLVEHLRAAAEKSTIISNNNARNEDIYIHISHNVDMQINQFAWTSVPKEHASYEGNLRMDLSFTPNVEKMEIDETIEASMLLESNNNMYTKYRQQRSIMGRII